MVTKNSSQQLSFYILKTEFIRCVIILIVIIRNAAMHFILNHVNTPCLKNIAVISQSREGIWISKEFERMKKNYTSKKFKTA